MARLTQSYITGEGSGQLLYETIGTCFDRVVTHHPGNPALIVSHPRVRWTNQELKRQLDRLPTALLALAIKPE